MGRRGLEIERKYLLSGPPPGADLAALGAQPTRLEQAYLRSSDGWVRRVRRIDVNGSSRYVLTRKRDREGIVRDEIEADISPEEYGRLLADADPARRIIRKVRHVIRHGRWTLELDVFSEPPGLVLLEVELDDPDEVPDLPASIAALVVREVSLEPAYANYRLALRPDAPARATSERATAPPLTGPGAGGTLAPMAPQRPDDAPDELPPSEAARARRRDHDAGADARSGMRTGLAKQFKQVLDAQVRRARRPAPGEVRPRGEADDEVGEPPPKKRGHPGRRPDRPL